MSTSDELTAHIDELLVKYLTLLDEYTQLRAESAAAQSSLFQNIARANFHADRGVRYGADLYDERIQASKRCQVTDEGTFDIVPDTAVAAKPIRMFGAFVPPALQAAEAVSETVVSTIPRILNTSVAMRELEIQIGRARKHKAKALKEEMKAKEALGTGRVEEAVAI